MNKEIKCGLALAVAAIVAAGAPGQDISKIPMSGMVNMLKLPIAVGEAPQAPFVVVKPTFENMPTNLCRALQVADIVFDPVTRKVRGVMGGCVYPSMAEAAFVVTNEIRSAVSAASGNSAIVVPFRNINTYGEELYWWRPSPDSQNFVELVVRAYKNKSGQVFIGTLFHTRGDDIAAKFDEFSQND